MFFFFLCFFRDLLPGIRRKSPLSIPKEFMKIGDNSTLINIEGKMKKEQTGMQTQVNLLKFI